MTRWRTRHRHKERLLFWERPRRNRKLKTSSTTAIGGTFQIHIGLHRSAHLPFDASPEAIRQAIDDDRERLSWFDEQSEFTLESLRKFQALYQGEFLVTTPAPVQEKAHWEAVHDEDDPSFWRVRWSEPDAEGRYLYVRHYGGRSATWNEHVARTQAEDFNEDGRSPHEWESYRPRKETPA